MEWEKFVKKSKKRGRKPRRPVETLQTIAWFNCLAQMLDIDTLNNSNDSICGDIATELEFNGYKGSKYTPQKENYSVEHSCKDWLNGASSPDPKSNEKICEIVEQKKLGNGIRLWTTFYYGIDGCRLWHKFDQYSQDPLYDFPQSLLPKITSNLQNLATSTDRFIQYLTRETALIIEASEEICNQFLIGGFHMAVHNCSDLLSNFGISADMYISITEEQVFYLLTSDPIKYKPADVLKHQFDFPNSPCS